MARTNPHHDWPEPLSGPHRSNGAEWESLRNELVALLDQVEDQVATAHSARQRPQAASVPPAPAAFQSDRHSEALRSVRQAVNRLAERATEDRPVMRESVVDAIHQIRARQTGGARPATTAPNAELTGFAKALDAMGERIGRFEARIAEQIEALGADREISNQIAQLSEVIELLAGAVGETGQIKRLEAQIGNLAETIAASRPAADETSTERLAELTVTVEKLLAHQIETSAQQAQQVARSDDRQAETMAMIEQSVRNIYDRIDALEANSQPSDAIDRLSHDMAALTEAVSRKSEPEALLAKIDALGERIGAIEAPSRDEAAMLAESVSVLRGVISETFEPRFARLEERMNELGASKEPASIDAVEAQLRQIAQRVDETSAQLKAMAAIETPAAPAAPDLEALADLIAEKSRALAPASIPSDADGVEKADLEALEQRLAALFARSSEKGSDTPHLAGMRNSIAQVDNRIARLETMLNNRPAAAASAAAPAPEAAPSRPRRKPADTMPVDPTTGEASQAPQPETIEPAAPEPDKAAEPKPFTLDPDTIDRPAKPQSSLNLERASPFAADSPERGKTETAPSVSASTRASFIEAARRSARQPEAGNFEEPKSLIGRALARFQRSEAQAAEDEAPVATPPVAEPVAERRFDDDQDEEQAQSFFARNRRALLLGTALVAVVALTVPLVASRIMPPRSAPVEEAQALAPIETQQPPADTAEPAAVSDAETATAAPDIDSEEAAETGSLTSNVRFIEQQPSLTAAQIDHDAFSANPTIDPIQTAAIGAASSYAAADAPIDTAAAIVQDLPEAVVPEEIEPEALRLAAQSGDRYAQFEVGAILTEGTLVEQDFTQAAAWYERSAAQGFAPAQYRLGSLYEGGRGVERDLEMARLWYQRAAEAGNRMSMHNLASLYAGGELESQDFEAAAHWFEQAASRGLTDSQFNLGMLHARGLGVEQDFEQSYLWFSLAARSGDQDAAASRDDAARSLDAETIQRLDAQIEAWAPSEIDLAANFAPIGTWDETFDPGPAIANRDVVLQVQMLLGKLGYDIGTPDGISGPKTREAIAEFERATGMTESGAINPRLLAVLGSQPV
ncbi:peptidoglycan-binding protein [Pelagibacterium sp. 26DY04]|uniref:peptidoglycan-binding protein n=1 Tax=Pelagibacterium sp. 26DY04 TaxID=2967130 RepID=UPI002814D2D1|nr:peptidoglycan-binding protein [Pelagibacterium sp. 26DY04]WMT87713.1 peptidoglycan-binding protein [Pelagibacterium sp. 26DY04]